MSIAQRKDGRFVVKYKDNGQWKQRSFKIEAEAAKFDGTAILTEATQDTRTTMGELMVAFFNNNVRHKSTKQSVLTCFCGNYNKRLNQHSGGEAAFLFDRYADTLTRKDLEAVRNNLRQKGNKNSTINAYISHIKAMLSWGYEQDLIPCNPWKGYKNLPRERREIRVSMEAFKKVYACAPAWLQWAMKTAFCLCLRPGRVELFRLKWSSFDFEYGTVTIRQGKSGIPKTVVPPIPYMEEAKARWLKDKDNGFEYVCTRNGKLVMQYHWSWDKATKRAGVKMRPYDIRHLAATTMLANGADLPSVAAQLGHQDCSITGRVYAHATNAGQRKAASTLILT